MSTENLDASAPNANAQANKEVPKSHPAPPMIWMLLPVALIALLVYLSR